MWTLSFKDINDQTVTVEISGGNGTLTGSVEPLVTQIDGEKDAMKPVRTSSGYLSVINEGNLQGLMPQTDTAHTVTVKKGGATVWMGTMQAQQFGRDMYLPNETVKYAIMDTLSVMDTVMMENTGTYPMETLASLITECINCLPSAIRLETVLVPTEQTNMLGLSVSRLNWFRDNDAEEYDESGDKKATYMNYDRISYKELLSEICKAMGVTAVVEGKELRLITTEETNYTRYAWNSVGTGGTAVTLGSTMLSTKQSASVDNQRTTVLGYKSVGVSGNANAVSDTDITINTDSYGFSRVITGGEGNYKSRTLIYGCDQGKMKLTSYIVRQESATTAETQAIGYNVDQQLSGYGIVTRVGRADVYNQQDVKDGTKISYEYKDCIMIESNLPTYQNGPQLDPCTFESVEVAKFTGTTIPPVSNGCFDLNFSAGVLWSSFGVAEIDFMLAVGDKYYNGSGWGSSPTKVHTILTQQGTVEVTKTIEMLYDDAAHFVIPIDTLISGPIEFTLYGTTSALYQSRPVMFIRDLELKYCNVEVEQLKELSDKNTRTMQTGVDSPDKQRVELRLTEKSPRCKNGFGITYSGSDQSAIGYEMALLHRMKRQYGRNREFTEPRLRGGAIAAGDIVSYDATSWQVVAKDINWRDDEIKLTMIEL